ncbi:hypothetical protein [Flavihumibacter profundi]|uniref:hypothetical protein n=1 Tax=Flavihumibacter profundi TaxID=2716883 RepID=UPI001CC7CA9E|nr:hypothetical protein [Flavihumibacter profundi]MBZ5856386.1 hypothetical protein [Flavihumibacter profundi]
MLGSFFFVFLSCFPDQSQISRLESENAQLKEKIKVLEDKIVKLEFPPIAKKAAVKSKKKKIKATDPLFLEASIPQTENNALVKDPALNLLLQQLNLHQGKLQQGQANYRGIAMQLLKKEQGVSEAPGQEDIACWQYGG